MLRMLKLRMGTRPTRSARIPRGKATRAPVTLLESCSKFNLNDLLDTVTEIRIPITMVLSSCCTSSPRHSSSGSNSSFVIP